MDNKLNVELYFTAGRGYNRAGRGQNSENSFGVRRRYNNWRAAAGLYWPDHHHHRSAQSNKNGTIFTPAKVS